MLRFRGSQQLRQRLVFATLSGRTVRIDGIRERDESPGLHDYEANLLRLLEKLTNGCVVEINETGEPAAEGLYNSACVAGRLLVALQHPCAIRLNKKVKASRLCLCRHQPQVQAGLRDRRLRPGARLRHCAQHWVLPGGPRLLGPFWKEGTTLPACARLSLPRRRLRNCLRELPL